MEICQIQLRIISFLIQSLLVIALTIHHPLNNLDMNILRT